MFCWHPKQNSSKRNKYADFLKGILIILVVLGHSIQGAYPESNEFYSNFAFTFIYTFHMPMFAVVSGFFFFYTINKYSLWKIVKNKLMKLIYPILIFCYIITTAGYIIHFSERTLLQEIGMFFDFFTRGYWYLRTIFECCMIILLFYRVLRLKKVGILIVNIVIYFLPITPTLGFLLPFFSIGFFIAEHKDVVVQKLNQISNWLLLPLTGLQIVTVFLYKPEVYIYQTGTYIFSGTEHQIYITFIRLLIGIYSCFWFTMITKALFVKIKNSLITKWLISFGTISLEIYILQDRVLWLVNYVTKSISNIFLYSVITCGIAFTIACITVWIIKKIPIIHKILFGLVTFR